MICPLCGNKEFNKLKLINEISRYDNKKYPLYRCEKCGLVRPDPLPYTEESKVDFYDSPEKIKFFNSKTKTFEFNSAEYKYYFKHFNPFLDFINKHNINGSALDVGCGPGHLMFLLKKKGFKVEGQDISPALAKALRDKFRVYSKDLRDKIFKDKKYDLVTLNQVIEHVENPREFVDSLNSLLKNKGYLILATPYIYGLVPQILRSKWYGLGYGQHLNFFDKKSMEKLLRNGGFKIIDYKILIVDYAHPKFPKFINFIADIISKSIMKLGLGDNMFVVAQKVKGVENDN